MSEKTEGLERFLQDNSNEFAKRQRQQGLNWTGSFVDYLKIVQNKPKVTRSAFQRLYDAIINYGFSELKRGDKTIISYNFFSDPFSGGKDAVFGLKESLMDLVGKLKSAAEGHGIEKRVLLLVGPVGSVKSTIARLLKRGLECYSRTDEGALYTYSWKNGAYYVGTRGSAADPLDWIMCPLHEEPLRLIPEEERGKVLEHLGIADKVKVSGDLCPACRKVFNILLKEKYDGDFLKLLEENVRVERLLLSEKDRVGIGTFVPSDEKNQDSTELTGDINYRQVTIIGSESDPRAFDFAAGEFITANRGMIEFIEVLKLDVAFLYALLGASQEHIIKPGKFQEIDVDEVIIGHTNEPEYQRFKNNELMEAMRDRTVTIPILYGTTLSEEVKIYQRDYNKDTIPNKHIAPHTLEMAATWSILTRLEEVKGNLTLIQKLKLYDGKILPGFTQQAVDDLRKNSQNEGRTGISPRFIQGCVSNALVRNVDAKCLNPFMVLAMLEEGLENSSLITDKKTRDRFKSLIEMTKEEYTDVVKNEVQKAITADEETLSRLAGNYLDNVKAYTQKEKVKNKFTQKFEDPDERLMRSIEEKIEIPEGRKDEFRSELMGHIGAASLQGEKFDYRQNERLLKALELKLFEDQKDTIKLSSMVAQNMDEDTKKKVAVVRDRLINNYGYCPECSEDVLNYVASVFARGDSKKEKQPK